MHRLWAARRRQQRIRELTQSGLRRKRLSSMRCLAAAIGEVHLAGHYRRRAHGITDRYARRAHHRRRWRLVCQLPSSESARGRHSSSAMTICRRSMSWRANAIGRTSFWRAQRSTFDTRPGSISPCTTWARFSRPSRAPARWRRCVRRCALIAGGADDSPEHDVQRSRRCAHGQLPNGGAARGREWFRACAIEYVRAHPARSPVLATYGEEFASFLTRFQPAAELPLPARCRAHRSALGGGAHSAGCDSSQRSRPCSSAEEQRDAVTACIPQPAS